MQAPVPAMCDVYPMVSRQNARVGVEDAEILCAQDQIEKYEKAQRDSEQGDGTKIENKRIMQAHGQQLSGTAST